MPSGIHLLQKKKNSTTFYCQILFIDALLTSIAETVHLRLGLEPTRQDSNLAKTHGLPTEIIHLVSGLNEAQVLDVSSQKEFSERQSNR